MENNKVELNIMVIPEVKEYLIKQSNCFEMSVDDYLTIIIKKYRQQSQSLCKMAKMLSK